jgi:hypothetical protein
LCQQMCQLCILENCQDFIGIFCLQFLDNVQVCRLGSCNATVAEALRDRKDTHTLVKEN